MAMPATVTAQEGELTLDDLFATPKLTGTTPSRPVWAPNSEHFAFSWSEPGNPGRGLWVSTSDGKEVRLSSNTVSPPVSDIVWTDANTIVSLRGNNLWQTSLSQGVDLQFMPVEAGAHNLSISPSGNQAAYIRNGDLWLADFPSKQNRQLTEIGIASLSSLRKGRYSRPEREIGPGIWSGPTYKWSPDGKKIAFHVVDRREMRKVPFPDYLAAETNPNEVRRSYPGDPNEIRRVGLLDVESGNIMYLDLPDPHANQVIDFNWSPGGDLLVDTASDTAVERKLFVVAPGESQLREIWRGVRESRMYTSFGSTWHPDGQQVVFLSDMGDRYGLYTIDASPSKDRPQLLTDPSYDVLSAPSIAGDALFYAGNGVNPYEQHVYRLNMSGGDPEQVTRLSGQNVGYPSPDGRHLVFMHSNDTSPPELYVVSSEGGDATRVTQSPLPAFTERTWAAAEYVSFPSLVDDYTLHARILKPANMQPGKKYPVLFGPVYSNTARNRWAGNYSLVQHLLAKKGYIIVQVDSRGSNGYGRAFREEFLLGFADQDIEDYASAVAYMESMAYVDPDRIGIFDREQAAHSHRTQQGDKDTELRGSTEEQRTRVGKQRTEIRERADAHENQQGRDAAGDGNRVEVVEHAVAVPGILRHLLQQQMGLGTARIVGGEQGSHVTGGDAKDPCEFRQHRGVGVVEGVLDCGVGHTGAGNVGQDAAEADRHQQQRLVVFGGAEVNENRTDDDHDHMAIVGQVISGVGQKLNK